MSENNTYLDGTGIQLGASHFELKSAKPLDSRARVKNIEGLSELNKIGAAYAGLIVYVEDQNDYYACYNDHDKDGNPTLNYKRMSEVSDRIASIETGLMGPDEVSIKLSEDESSYIKLSPGTVAAVADDASASLTNGKVILDNKGYQIALTTSGLTMIAKDETAAIQYGWESISVRKGDQSAQIDLIDLANKVTALTNVVDFVGVGEVTTDTDGDIHISIPGIYSFNAGNVALSTSGQEYVYDGRSWQPLGDADYFMTAIKDLKEATQLATDDDINELFESEV